MNIKKSISFLLYATLLYFVVTLCIYSSVILDKFPKEANQIISKNTNKKKYHDYAGPLLQASCKKQSLTHLYNDYTSRSLDIRDCIISTPSISTKIEYLEILPSLVLDEHKHQIEKDVHPFFHTLAKESIKSDYILSEYYIHSILQRHMYYWLAMFQTSSFCGLTRYKILKEYNQVIDSTLVLIPENDVGLYNTNMYLIVNDTTLLDYNRDEYAYNFTPIKHGLDSLSVDIIIRNSRTINIYNKTIYYEVE